MSLPSNASSNAVREAWRCDACKQLIYSTDRKGYPVPDAPPPWWGNIDFKQICSMCKGMFDVIANSDYWRSLHREWELLQAKRRDDIDKQTGRRDYFSGQ